MTQTTYRPNGEGQELEWNLQRGQTIHYIQVDEDPPDEDTTYVWEGVYIPNGFPDDCYNIEDPGSELDGETINYIEVFHRGKCTDFGFTCSVAPILYIAGYGLDYGSVAAYQNAYNTFSDRWTTNPDTGSAWTKQEIIDLQIGVSKIGAARNVRCTQVYLVVDHEEAVENVKLINIGDVFKTEVAEQIVIESKEAGNVWKDIEGEQIVIDDGGKTWKIIF